MNIFEIPIVRYNPEFIKEYVKSDKTIEELMSEKMNEVINEQLKEQIKNLVDFLERTNKINILYEYLDFIKESKIVSQPLTIKAKEELIKHAKEMEERLNSKINSNE